MPQYCCVAVEHGQFYVLVFSRSLYIVHLVKLTADSLSGPRVILLRKVALILK